MTDKEMTELAAVALGLDVEWMTDNQGCSFLHNYENGCEFDPLHNDGDAFRLMVNLGLCVVIESDMVFCRNQRSDKVFRDRGKDKHNAVRRTIVSAAAEIGKKMKK